MYTMSSGDMKACCPVAGYLPHTLLSFSVLATLIPTTICAQITVDPKAPHIQSAHVVSPARGPIVIQIARPNGSGVSHNKYSQFNVGNEGLILSNNADNTHTQLRGDIKGNPYLSNGKEAHIIVNEVTGKKPSELNGKIEVAGQRADVIISNPNNITVNGLSLMNANKTVLTTGLPAFGGSGTLDSWRVTGGSINVEGMGLNNTASAQTDILARSVKINADMWADKLTVITGNNKIDYSTHSIRAIKGPENNTVVALDIAALGGMYANKIRLVGTEAGMGVKDYGEVTMQAGDFEINQNNHTHTPKKTAHQLLKRDNDSSSDESNNTQRPLNSAIEQQVIDEINEIEFPNLVPTTPYRNTSDSPANDSTASALPVLTASDVDNIVSSTDQRSIDPIRLSPLPLVGGPLGVIPSPEQGSPLGVVTSSRTHGPIGIIPYPGFTQSAHSSNTTPPAPAKTPPPYGWKAITTYTEIPGTSRKKYASSWSIVPVGQAPIVPLGVIPIVAPNGTAQHFLPPGIFGITPGSLSASGMAPVHDEHWNRPGPSGTQQPCSEASCPPTPSPQPPHFYGSMVPKENGSFWDAQNQQRLLHNATASAPPRMPATWDIPDLMRFISRKVSSPYAHWIRTHNTEEPGANYSLNTRYKSRAISIYYDTRNKRIVSVKVSPVRKLNKPINTTSSTTSTSVPEHAAIYSNSSIDSAIETPPSDAAPPTPGKKKEQDKWRHDEL